MAARLTTAKKPALDSYQTAALGGLDPSLFEQPAPPANDPTSTPFGQHSVAAPLPQPGQSVEDQRAAARARVANDAALAAAKAEVVRNATAQGKASRQRAADTSSPGGWLEGIARDVGAIGGYAFTGGPIVDAIADYTPGAVGKGISNVQDAAVDAGRFVGGATHNVAAIPFNAAAGNSLIPADSTLGQAGGDVIDALGNLIPNFNLGGGGTGTPLSGVVGGGGGAPAGRAGAVARQGNIDQMLQGIQDGSLMPGTSDATQRGVLNQAQNYQPIANTSDATQRGVLNSAQDFRPTNAQNALNSVGSFRPDGTYGALNQVNALDPTANSAFAQQQVDAFGNSVRPQTDVMGRAKAFDPMAAETLLAELEQFRTKQEGPSKAEILLSQANDDAMSNALSLARSGRGSVGDQSRQLQTAIGENAATSIDNARNMSLLRAEEEQQFRNQLMQSLGLSGDISGAADQAKLGALGIEGNLAQSLDEGTLKALGLSTQLGLGMDQSRLQKAGLQADLGKSLDDSTLRALGLETQLGLGMDNSLLQALGIQSDTANAMRSADVTERGQSMDATLRALGISADTANSMRNASVTERGQGLSALTSLAGTSAGLTGDILSSDTSLGVAGMNNANENARLERELQYKLTPNQQLLLAGLGASGDILSKFI